MISLLPKLHSVWGWGGVGQGGREGMRAAGGRACGGVGRENWSGTGESPEMQTKLLINVWTRYWVGQQNSKINKMQIALWKPLALWAGTACCQALVLESPRDDSTLFLPLSFCYTFILAESQGGSGPSCVQMYHFPRKTSSYYSWTNKYNVAPMYSIK